MKTNYISIILAFTLILGCLSGCAEAPAAETPEVTAPATETQIIENVVFDYESAFASFEPGNIVFTVNGTEITWKEYFGWLFNVVMQYEMYYGAENLWDLPTGTDETTEESFKSYTELMCTQFAVVNSEAAALEISLDEEDLAEVEAQLIADAQSYTNGDIEAFKAFLAETYMDVEYYSFIRQTDMLYEKLFEHLYGPAGESYSDEEVMQFIESNEYLHAKHILFLTNDNTGAPLDDTAKAEKLDAANAALSELKAITDTDELLVRFDELMNELSEDGGLAAYPDGYYFLPGEMVTEFENGTKELENYNISDVIESPYGYHIILRLPINADDIYEGEVTFRSLAATAAFGLEMSDKFNNVEIEYTKEFADLSLDDIFTTKIETQEVVVPVETPVAEVTPEPEKDYSLVKNTENTQKLTSSETFFLIAIISILIYTVPVFIYRYRIKKAALENKEAIMFTAVYGVIMLIILGGILIFAKYYAIAAALLIWTYINYYILSYKA